MKKTISYIRQTPLGATLFILLVAVGIMVVGKYLSADVFTIFLKNIELNFYTRNSIYKLVMLVLSLGAIVMIKQDSLKSYGFQRPKQLHFWRMLGIATAFIIGSLFVGNIIFNGLCRHFFPVSNQGQVFPAQDSLMQMILTVWIWSSICEEVLTRGLVQSFLSPFITHKFLKLSLPIWISGLLFGAMHAPLLLFMDTWFAAFIVFNTTILGLVTAYYREKTDSIYPAIFIHFWFNVIGSAPLLLQKLAAMQ